MRVPVAVPRVWSIGRPDRSRQPGNIETDSRCGRGWEQHDGSTTDADSTATPDAQQHQEEPETPSIRPTRGWNDDARAGARGVARDCEQIGAGGSAGRRI